MTLARCAAALTVALALGFAPHARAEGQTASSDPPAAAGFRYAGACESREQFLSRLAELSSDLDVEHALARHHVDVSIVQLEPEQWTLTVQRNTASGTQGRVLREKSCEQLATAARVVLSVWLREESELPAGPPPPPAAPPPPAPPVASEIRTPVEKPETLPSDDPSQKRIFGMSALVEASSSYYVAPAAAVTGELWTLFEQLRISVALSYWTSLREWAGDSAGVRVRGWDATGQLAYFMYQSSALALGVMGAISAGWVRSDELVLGVRTPSKRIYLRPTAAGVLVWSFARPLRLRVMLGLTHIERSPTDDGNQIPSLYAATGLDLEF